MSLICFDLDNTLVDSDKLQVFAFKKAFKNHNLKEFNDSKIAKLFGPTGDIIIKTLYPELSDKEVHEILKEHNEYVVQYANKKLIKPFPGVKATLKKLKEDYELGAISNSSHKEIIAELTASGFDLNIFDIIVGSDDVKRGKPWPDEILKAERLTHHNAEYMVGDSPMDIIAGKRAKCKTVSVLTGHYSRKRLKAENPDYIIKNLKKILEVLK